MSESPSHNILRAQVLTDPGHSSIHNLVVSTILDINESEAQQKMKSAQRNKGRIEGLVAGVAFTSIAAAVALFGSNRSDKNDNRTNHDAHQNTASLLEVNRSNERPLVNF